MFSGTWLGKDFKGTDDGRIECGSGRVITLLEVRLSESKFSVLLEYRALG